MAVPVLSYWLARRRAHARAIVIIALGTGNRELTLTEIAAGVQMPGHRVAGALERLTFTGRVEVLLPHGAGPTRYRLRASQ